jgi:predicted small lipoprotein YifL
MFITKTIIAASILLLLLPLNGCGRKGALYMQPVPVKPATAVQAQPEQEPAKVIPEPSLQSEPESKK